MAAAAAALACPGCVGVPEGVEPVRGFELERYLGTWYEIARLDHSFERGLTRVTAEYALREDGGVRVLNRGFSQDGGKWKQAEGKAFFVGSPSVAHLKVSFFGPFYGSYIVVDIDREYRHALVSGPDRTYLWILAREPEPDETVVGSLVARAAALGFDTGALIRVSHRP